MSMQSVLDSFFQFEINSKAKADSFVYLLGSGSAVIRARDVKKIIEQHAFDQHKAQLLKSEKALIFFNGQNGPVWILQNRETKKSQHHGMLDESAYAWFRDQAGPLVGQFKNHLCENIVVHFSGLNDVMMRGFIVGLDLGSYNFLNAFKKVELKKPVVNLLLGAQGRKLLTAALTEAKAVQVARHLVNLPPNLANPETIEQIVKKELGFPKSLSIEVWDFNRLLLEKMNLLAAVGQGSDTLPRMLRIKYRPKKKSPTKPIAFVGKGITFDTGGLDLKPSSAMRLMKKDMGGAAAVIGLAYWAVHSGYSRDCDFYLALAENSVDGKSMRPGDVYISRAGYAVEIDNTDAEGRLVLADVMDVAATQKGKDEPEFLIDIATLTGAIKVALGAEVAGLFCNNDALAQQLHVAGTAVGELNWRMPLIQKYFSSLSSGFADFKNSGEGFGGAITAALFLEKFCGGKKWAHLDVYSWNDKPHGALTSTGGSGQPVQSMIEWLKKQL